MKGNFLALVFLLVFSFPSVKSLLATGGYTSHDLTHHVVRQIDMDRLLGEGQFPPRWSGELNNGFGYPLFLFNYPLPPIIGEFFHLIGFNFVSSVKAVLLTSMIISVVGMYLFLNELFDNKNKLGAFLGAVFYLYAPIRFLNVYVSAALGNATALEFLPFVFWAIVLIAKRKKWAMPLGAIALFALVTSHNVTALMFGPVIFGFSLILGLRKKNSKQFFKNLLFMFLLGLGLSAFFWIPALAEKHYIIYEVALPGFWKDHFPTFSQLIHSPWGYGLSQPGPDDAISFQIGLTQILVILLTAPLLIVFRRKKEFLTLGIFSIFFFVLSVFLMLEVSIPVWENLPLISLVQFPARFLAVAVFISSITASFLVKYLPFNKIAFIFLLALVLYANRNHLRVNQQFDPGEDYYLSQKGTTAFANEHLPKWGYIPKKPASSKIIFLEGKGEIQMTENKSAKVSAVIETSEKAILRFNQFYFPGWSLKVDGKNVEFSYLGEGENKGLPIFSLGPGSYIFEATFEDTPIRKLADLISLSSFIFLTVYFFYLVRSKR